MQRSFFKADTYYSYKVENFEMLQTASLQA